MRVLLLNYEYPPCGSGAGLATQALAEGLASRGVTVDVVTGGGLAGSEPRLFWDGDADEEGLLTVHRVACRRRSEHEAGIRGAVDYLAAATPLVRRLLEGERYDVVHFIFSLPTAAMLPLLDLRHAPVIVSLRGSDVPGFDAEQVGVQRAHRLLHPLTRWIWRRADRVVVPSESLGRLARRTDSALRFAVVQGGVDLARFRPRVALRRIPDDVVRCLAVARLVERNGLDDLIDALALLERGRYQLEIVGTGPYEEALRDRVRLAGSRPRCASPAGWSRPRSPGATARRICSHSRPGSSRSAPRSSRRSRRGSRSWAARPAGFPSWSNTAATDCWSRRAVPESWPTRSPTSRPTPGSGSRPVAAIAPTPSARIRGTARRPATSPCTTASSVASPRAVH